MAKYLELSANANVSSATTAEGNNFGNANENPKVKPYQENGEVVGYVLTSPKTKRNVFVGLDNEFNHNYALPTFMRTFSIPEENGLPAELMAVLAGQAIYLKQTETGIPDISECMPLGECEWESDGEKKSLNKYREG